MSNEATGARRQPLDTGQARAVRRVELALEQSRLVARAEEQVAVHALEVAVDPLGRDDRLDAVDGRAVALGRAAGAHFAVDALDLEVAVVDRIGEMGGGASRLAASRSARRRAPAPTAGAGEQVRGRESGDPRPDDADIHRFIGVEQRIGRRLEEHPN